MDLNSHVSGPEEDEVEMVQYLLDEMEEIEKYSFSPESSPQVMSITPEEHHAILFAHAYYGDKWVGIAQSLTGRTYDVIENYWNSTLKRKSSSMTNADLTISDHNNFIQPPYVSTMNRQQRNSTIHDFNLSQLAVGGVSDQAPYIGGMAMETRSQNFIHEKNSNHEVGGMVSGQAPSISDMARGNMSSGGTHSYSRDRSAPSWNALYIRDSSPMMIDSESVQQFMGSEFGRNDFSEVSSIGIVQGKGW